MIVETRNTARWNRLVMTNRLVVVSRLHDHWSDMAQLNNMVCWYFKGLKSLKFVAALRAFKLPFPAPAVTPNPRDNVTIIVTHMHSLFLIRNLIGNVTWPHLYSDGELRNINIRD